MNKKISTHLTICAIGVGCVAVAICLLVLTRLIDNEPLVADGKENLTAASILIRYRVFSSIDSPAPTPDMMREPAWPFATAGLLLLTGLDQVEPHCLAIQHHCVFKVLNAVILALVAGLASGLAWSMSRNRIAAWGLTVIVACITFTTIPRMVNRFNNDPMAMLLLTIVSALTYFSMKGTWRSWVGLGLVLGFLALTKAQFLYIAVVPIVAVACFSLKRAGFVLLTFVLVVTPWLARNTRLYGEPAISVRGKTVAAVRLIMVTKYANSELACMAYAFTHPRWRGFVGGVIGVEPDDFDQGGKCQRFNREIAFDMGIERVGASPFAQDITAMNGGDWRCAVQYFYQGMALGRELEAGHHRLSEVAPFSLDNLARYVKTLPLFAWRGLGFSGFPILSILLTVSMFFLLMTRAWPLAVLAIASHVFHLALTHNIPRYHAVELGVMIMSMVYFFDEALGFICDRWKIAHRLRGCHGVKP